MHKITVRIEDAAHFAAQLAREGVTFEAFQISGTEVLFDIKGF